MTEIPASPRECVWLNQLAERSGAYRATLIHIRARVATVLSLPESADASIRTNLIEEIDQIARMVLDETDEGKMTDHGTRD